MRIKLFWSGLVLLLFASVAFAAWNKKPEFRWQQLYRYDLRQDNHQLYVNRLSMALGYLDKKEKSLFKLTPYLEMRRNIDKDLWERKELGIEIGKDIFSWLYLGEAIQRGWMREDYRYRADYEKISYAESETRLLFSHSLLNNKYIKLKGFVLGEYTYDFDEGKGVRNEVAIGLIMPIAKFIETDIHWRHIDRIPYYDSDTFEAAVSLVF